MKKQIKIALLAVLGSLCFGSCSLFGLDYAEDADYNAQQVTNKIDQTVWEYINDNSDVFGGMIDAIRYAGVEDLYKQTGNTYILLRNDALINTGSSQAYWNRNLVPKSSGSTVMIKAGSWEQYPKEEIAQLLKYHILQGEWSFFNLSDAVNWVSTFGDGKFTYVKEGQTMQADTAVVDIRIGMDRGNPLQFNNYAWNYRGLLAVTAASTYSTNIQAKDGYIHTTNYYLPRPTRANLGYE